MTCRGDPVGRPPKTMKTNGPQTGRKPTRLKDFDYSQIGAYFVTICTYRRAPWFGVIENGEMRMNRFGQIAWDEWLRTSEIRPGVTVDSFVVMPNHFHGILNIAERDRATHRVAPMTLRPDSIGSIIGQFKAAVTRDIRRSGLQDFGWQRNYYEHVIRDDADLNEIREYISGNPVKWQLDKENPEFALSLARGSQSKQASRSGVEIVSR